MERLAVRRLEYSGDRYSFTSPGFGDELVIIEGKNGAGKTTLADLIYFGLGGNPDKFRSKSHSRHKEVSGDTNNLVRLTVEVTGEAFFLTRRFATPEDIIVTPVRQAESRVLPIVRRGDAEVFSDWMLQRLGMRSVPIQMGPRTWRINFTDILRLLYHDQSADYFRVFRRPDAENFVSDSEDQRRAIFEILIGASSERYYEALAEQRRSQLDFDIRQATLKAYVAAAGNALQGQLDRNETFLRERIKEVEAQLARTQEHRRKLRDAKTVDAANEAQLLEFRGQLANAEVGAAELEQQVKDLSHEASRLADLQAQFIEEVVRIRKIIHAHEVLSLFSPDTCPCCLKPVTRAVGKCICGQAVDEGSFQRFFYASDEYVAILKSKQKNVETLAGAIQSRENEIENLRKRIAEKREERRLVRGRIARWVGREGRYTTELEATDDRLVELRVELEQLQAQVAVELERDRLQRSVEAARSALQAAKDATEEARLAAEAERRFKIERFNAIYTELLRDTLRDVRVARLGGDYEPIINEGEYREASSSVARRLMYYLTLFKMSLEDPTVRAPRFLLIDTPENAGIDQPELRAAIGKVQDVLAEFPTVAAQVILTTGVRKYPSELKSKVVLTLEKDGSLLRPKGASQS